MGIYQVLYVSVAEEELTKKDVDKILRKARINNPRKKLTGVLMLGSGLFLQLLEGKKEEVLNLLEKIREDSRHKEVEILMERAAASRMFKNWSMAYSEMGELDVQMAEKIKHWRKRSSQSRIDEGSLVIFLEQFKQKNMRFFTSQAAKPSSDFKKRIELKTSPPRSNDAGDIYQLLYVSIAKRDLTQEDVNDILHKARKNNPGRNLTGVLMFGSGMFLQLLEGKKEDVLEIFKKIDKDSRHKGVDILILRSTEQRIFGKWSMAYSKIEKLDFEMIKKIRAWQTQYKNKEVDEQSLMVLLEQFKQKNYKKFGSQVAK